MVSPIQVAEFQISWLLGRWLNLCMGLNAKGSIEYHRHLFYRLIYYYQQPGRYYHNLNHIEEMLRKFDEIKHLIHNPNAVELAIWFHDAIYEVWADDNEHRSGELARFFIINLMGLDLCLAKDVEHLIDRTAYFSKQEDESKIFSVAQDSRHLLDIDLFVGLGGDIYDFQRKKELTAREYDWVNDRIMFRKKRLEIFLMFHKRTPFYLTDYFRERYEERTKANLESAIREIEAELLPPKIDPKTAS